MFILLFSVICQSQTISDTDSREITYEKLGEFAKFVVYKDSSETIFSSYRKELKLKDSIILTKQLRLNFKDSTINTFYKINQNNEIQIIKKDGLLEISDIMYKEQKRKKWNFGIYGVILGTLLGIVLGISL
jgi:hypothetical protein